MSLSDKIGNKAGELGGKAKEAVGNATENDDLRAEGKADQLEAGVKGIVEDAKDAVDGVVGKLKDKFGK